MKYTVLVNKDNIMKEKYLKNINLIETKDVLGENILIEEKTYKAYNELKEYLEKNNIIIGITSSYRSVEEQTILYENGDKDFTAPPNYSEHHTGLAIDIGVLINEEYIEDETEELLSIHKILYKFGFILRYQKGKENITKYKYEPWHIRYVGKIPAKIMYEKNLTLEEYLSSFGGVLFINKPKGLTSFDVVNEISKSFGLKKVGHTGTLDPLATGVMLVAVGQATKIVELLTATDKEYIATVKRGIKTDTLDIEGEVIATKPLTNSNIKEALSTFKKTYNQEVPIYSAIKVNGKKLYEYARNKERVELPKKEVTIKKIELLEEKEDTFIFKTLVTKGCYIRSLIRDIGDSINEYMTMTELTRTKQGNVSIDITNTLEDIKNNNFKIYNIEEVLPYERIVVDKEAEFKIKNGVKLPNKYNITDKVIFLNNKEKLLGIYQRLEDCLVVWKNFN